jgi:(E)-4-hydroxy-3-methylbut-2-enyl-diphosphate synthase
VLILEKLGYEEIVLSMKAADVNITIDAYRLIADQIHYPLHVGVTEAGTKDMGTIKSAVGIGALLYMGIGDTIRVSLTADPIEEVRVGWDILKSLGLRTRGPEIISCPTCGRTRIDLLAIARQVEERIKHFQKPLKVAIMGCVVNGPGEAREADVGIAGGDGQGILFMKGKIVKSIPEDQLVQALIDAVEELEFSED